MREEDFLQWSRYNKPYLIMCNTHNKQVCNSVNDRSVILRGLAWFYGNVCLCHENVVFDYISDHPLGCIGNI